jgi:hypothetical protein
MTMPETFSRTDTDFSSSTAALPSNWIRLAGLRIVTWATTCADYYAAAAMYEQLSKLSNAELERRVLNRATLPRDVCDNCEGGNNR